MTTTNEPKGRPETGARGGTGYRGTLPAREDRLARAWLIIVAAIFVAILLLSVLGVPSRFVADPTPVPLPTNPPATESPSPSPTDPESPTLTPSPTG